jgi:hypothetical protein
MERYLIIDNYSGYIIGDTTDPKDKTFGLNDPIDACRKLSGVPVLRVPQLGPHDAGYRAYQASHFLTPISDRRHAHIIESIEQQCPCAAMVTLANS